MAKSLVASSRQLLNLYTSLGRARFVVHDSLERKSQPRHGVDIKLPVLTRRRTQRSHPLQLFRKYFRKFFTPDLLERFEELVVHPVGLVVYSLLRHYAASPSLSRGISGAHCRSNSPGCSTQNFNACTTPSCPSGLTARASSRNLGFVVAYRPHSVAAKVSRCASREIGGTVVPLIHIRSALIDSCCSIVIIVKTAS